MLFLRVIGASIASIEWRSVVADGRDGDGLSLLELCSYCDELACGLK